MKKLETVGLSKVFGPRPDRAFTMLEAGRSKIEVQEELGLAVGVHDVSFSINEGETFVLMGLSGSGKSTLLRLLNRLHEPTRGKVLVNGQEITGLSRRDLRQVRRDNFAGMVFQSFAILPHRSVLDNVAYGLEIQGVPNAKRRERAMEAIELVGLNGWESSVPAQLSGGMQQRVGLARSLAVDADIMLMDEAFSALDPLIRRELQDELVELQARMNKTIVFVTHDLDEALKLGDRIAIMRDAEIVQLGTAEEIVSEPADDYVKAFVEGVDRGGVLTAGNIMQTPLVTGLLRDGPQTMLRKLRRYGLSGLLVTDPDRTLHGYVTADELIAQARAEPGTPRPPLLDIPTVNTDTPLADLVEMAAGTAGPIAVTDSRNRLLGVVVKGAILAGLAGMEPQWRPDWNGEAEGSQA